MTYFLNFLLFIRRMFVFIQFLCTKKYVHQYTFYYFKIKRIQWIHTSFVKLQKKLFMVV